MGGGTEGDSLTGSGTLSYAAPTIDNVSTTDTEGGLVTIRGSSFGLAGAAVHIGETLCQGVSYLVPHSVSACRVGASAAPLDGLNVTLELSGAQLSVLLADERGLARDLAMKYLLLRTRRPARRERTVQRRGVRE